MQKGQRSKKGRREAKEERERKKKAKEEEKKPKESEKGKTSRGRMRKKTDKKETCAPTDNADGPIPAFESLPGPSGLSRRLSCRRKLTEKVCDAVVLSSSSESNEEDGACFLYGRINPPHPTGHSFEWISCWSCDRWYHEDCIGDSVDDTFVCHLCDD